MTKVALINPGSSSRFAVQEPLNLGYIAAYLEKNGIDVRIFDQLGGDDVYSDLEEFKPDFAGITSTTPVIYEAYALADYCRSKGIKTVMGGVHPWMFPEEALKHCDIVVRGEGEKAMLDIARGTAKGPIIDAGFIENIEELPLPARHLMKMDRYLYAKKYSPYILHLPYVSAKSKIIHIISSRGCPHSECIFCHNSFKRFPFRANSAEKVIEEIKQLQKNYGITAVYFVEDDFFTDTGRVVKICELMIKENLSHILWGASSRVEEMHKTDLKVFELAYKAGCRSLSIGFESGSQKTVDILKKGFIVEDSYAAIAKVRKAGLLIHGNIIIGAPEETMEDIRLTRKFIKKAALVTPEIYLFTPYPGSQIWCKLISDGKINQEFDWKRFNQEEVVLNLSKLPTETLNSLRTRMYLNYYLTHPKYGIPLLISSLKHPVAVFSKIVHMLAPLIKSYLKKKK